MSHLNGKILAAGIISILTVSTAAVVFPLITIADPSMKGGWRIQLTFIGFFCIALSRLRSNSNKYIDFLQTKKLRTLLSGLSLSLYFCFWCASLDLTSTAHSLLISCSSPIFLIAFYLITGRSVKKSEILGTILAFSGILLICTNYELTEKVTFLGDFLAFLSAIFVTMHFYLSEKLYDLGDYCYLSLVYFFGSFFCICFSMLFNFYKVGPSGLLVFLNNFDYLTHSEGFYVLHLGIFTGVLSGVLFYYFLSKASAFHCSVLLLFEPILGTFYSYILNFHPYISLYTWIGGLLVLLGNILANIYSKLPSPNTEPLLPITN